MIYRWVWVRGLVQWNIRSCFLGFLGLDPLSFHAGCPTPRLDAMFKLAGDWQGAGLGSGYQEFWKDMVGGLFCGIRTFEFLLNIICPENMMLGRLPSQL